MGKVRIIGTYQPKRSPLHGVDAKAKIIFMLLATIATIVAHSWISFAVLAVLLALALILAQVRPIQLAPALRPIGFMLLAFMVLCAIITRKPFAGLWTGVVVAGRLTLLVGFALAICATTTQTQLVDAFVQLLAPLGKLGLPTFKIACTLTVALRLIPVATEEHARISAARAARGLVAGGQGIRAAFIRMRTGVSALASGVAATSGSIRATMERRGYDASTIKAADHPLRVAGWAVIVVGVASIVAAVIL